MIHCDVFQIPFNLNRRSLGRAVAERERFGQEKVERFDSAYRVKAREHSTGRNRSVATLLCYLSLLRTAKAIRQHADVNWDKAHYQVFSASEGRDAAHVLPCQIMIDSRRPSDISPPALLNGEKLKNGLKELFAKVTSLPKVFNVADSRAENHCLRGALIHACVAAINETQPLNRIAGVLKRGKGLNYGENQLTLQDRPEAAEVGIDCKAVRKAYQVWIEKAREAFDRTIAAVEARGATVYGKDAKDEVIYILERYRESLDQPPAMLTDNVMFDLEEDLWA
jgi:hypothetical protein